MTPEIYQDGPCQICRPTGILDGQTGVLLHKAVRDALNSGGSGRLILECSGVDWADAAGCRQLIQLNQLMSGKGGLVLAAVSPALLKALETEGCEHFFEIAVSQPAAAQSITSSPIQSAPVPSTPPPVWNADPIDVLPTIPKAASAWDEIPAPPATPTSSPPALPAAPDLTPPPVASGWGDGWSSVSTPAGPTKARKAKSTGKPFPWKPIIFTCVPALVASAAYTFWAGSRSPEISVNPLSLKGEYGCVVDCVISVTRGTLSKSSRDELESIFGPDGVSNSESLPDVDDKDTIHYSITGSLGAKPGSYSADLIAERGDKKSDKFSLKLEVQPPAFHYRSEKFTLVAGEQVDTSTEDLANVYMVAENALRVEAEDPASLPSGLEIRKIHSDKKSGGNKWALAGTPASAGTFTVNLKSTNLLAEKQQEKSVEIIVHAAKPKPAPSDPGTPSANSGGVKPSDSPTAIPGAQQSDSLKTFVENPDASSDADPGNTPKMIDDKLRGFLLARIWKSSFSDVKKKMMEDAVSQLQVGTLLLTVPFEMGSADFTAENKENLERAIGDNEEFFQKHKEDLQFIIIGYASKPGKASKNKALSLQRARAVASVLKDRYDIGLAVGYGPTDVIGSGDESSGTAAQNQAVEVFVGIPPKEARARDVLDTLRTYIKSIYGKE